MRRPYPTYRDSGVEWLGAVPEHWEVAQVKRWFAIVNGGTPASGEEDYWDGETVWLTPGDLGRNSTAWISNGRRSITDDGVQNSSAHVCPEGSIVMSTRAPIGHLAIAAAPVTTNQGCRTLVPDHGTDSSFAYYSFVASRRVLRSLGQGTTFMELTPTNLGSLHMAHPPLEEQRAIAKFLDCETGKIDQLVGRKRLLIERLDEYRQALTTRTVTRGLPPDAARAAGLNPSPHLEPSGVEWLDGIPVHWEVRRLKDVGRIIGGAAFPEILQGVDGEELPFFKVADLKRSADGRWLTASDHTISRDSADMIGAHVIPASAIVYAKIGAALLLNRRRLTAVPACIDNNMSAYIPDQSRVSILWAFHTLSMVDFRNYVNPGAVPSLSEGDQAVIHILVPPIEEQRAIAAFLDDRLQRINALTSRVEVAIERLEEYRSALITAAVTGKIDVRGDVSAEAERVGA